MTPVTLGAIALVLGLVVGASVLIGAPVFAIPIVLIVLGGMAVNELARRRNAGGGGGTMRDHRRRAGLEGAEPSAEDRATLTEAAPRDHGGG